MPVFGYWITAARDGYVGRAVLQREIIAPDSRTARAWLDGWLAVEGYSPSDEGGGTDVLLVADGVTFVEAGRRRIERLARELAREFGASVVGPYGIGSEETPGYAVRVLHPSGYGLSIKTGGDMPYDPAPVIEFMAVYDDETDLTWSGFPGAMVGPERGEDVNDRVDMDRMRNAMRALPRN